MAMRKVWFRHSLCIYVDIVCAFGVENYVCATSRTMAEEGQYVDRADCQVCLVKRLTACYRLFVIFAGLCIFNVV
jgi:hypothetical protein